MAHKPECPKSKDSNATCTMNCETPAPATRKCWDCGAEIGKSEEKCPKCSADLKTADEEDEVVTRALKRMKNKKEAEKKAKPTPNPTDPPAKKKSPLLGLGRIIK